MTLYEDIIHLLEKGDFFEASNFLGMELEKNPDDIDIISGYYSIKYWQNRENFLYDLKNKPISFLLEEWEKFELKFKEKNYQSNIFTSTIKKFILQKVLQFIQHKIEKEGIEEKDFSLLLIVAKNLLSLHDFSYSRYLLSYCLNLDPHHSLIFFYLGETYCLEAELYNNFSLYPKGLSYIRDGFLFNTSSFPIEDIQSMIIKNIIKEVSFIYENETQKIFEWIPIYIMLKSFYPELRKLSYEEIQNIESEIDRLENELLNISKKFYEKTLTRLIFYYLVVIHSLVFHYSNEERFNDILNKLDTLSPKIYNELTKILSKEL